MIDDVQAPFTVSQMRKFADKLRNFSTTPTPESKPSGTHRHRRHSILSASATQSSGARDSAAQTPAGHSSAARDSATPESSWAASSLSPEFAPQKLLGQFGNSPHPLSTVKKPSHGNRHHHRHHSDVTPAVGTADSAVAATAAEEESAAGGTGLAAAVSDAAAATAGLRQGSEGQMMLLPAGVAMNDLLALAEEMDPGGSPEEGKKSRRDRRMLTANSTMQLAAYLASKVSQCLTGIAKHLKQLTSLRRKLSVLGAPCGFSLKLTRCAFLDVRLSHAAVLLPFCQCRQHNWPGGFVRQRMPDSQEAGSSLQPALQLVLFWRVVRQQQGSMWGGSPD